MCSWIGMVYIFLILRHLLFTFTTILILFSYHIITSYFIDKECIEEQCEQLQIELEHRCKGEQRQEQIMATERSKASMLESKVRHEYDLI